MTESQYIFTNSPDIKELKRLQTIEQVFDSASFSRLQATGIASGWCCLEVGAGAGSITRWMSTMVGESGKVVAIDLDTRFIAGIKLPNVEVKKADIRHFQIEKNSFDLIHVRFVLIHLSDFETALLNMLALLKPGGWLVVEEPDFSAARAIAGDAEACESMNRVNRAIFRTFASRGMTYDLGAKLPVLLQKLGLKQLSVDNDTPLVNGGSGIATVMKLSAIQLAETYIATGEASREDIEKYCLFADDQSAWAIYHATVGVTARKAAEN